VRTAREIRRSDRSAAGQRIDRRSRYRRRAMRRAGAVAAGLTRIDRSAWQPRAWRPARRRGGIGGSEQRFSAAPACHPDSAADSARVTARPAWLCGTGAGGSVPGFSPGRGAAGAAGRRRRPDPARARTALRLRSDVAIAGDPPPASPPSNRPANGTRTLVVLDPGLTHAEDKAPAERRRSRAEHAQTSCHRFGLYRRPRRHGR
jgi:hypothetical protein